MLGNATRWRKSSSARSRRSKRRMRGSGHRAARDVEFAAPHPVSGAGRRMTLGIAKMLVGVPKEIKDSEYRVGLVPSTVRELTRNGHQVLVEKSAGLGAGLNDADYRTVGAEIVPDV